ncbi:MAG: hypothetical protein Q7R41_05840 [Phycisphaerales bacterium]|nr:hypothetical protein [Phycisphaerales bacterium]
MAVPSTRFSQLRWLQNAVCVAALLGALLLVGLGLAGYGDSPGVWLVAAGAFVLVIVVLTMTIAPLLLKMEATLARQLDELRDLREAVAKQFATIDSIAENTRISDAAKSLARREQELDALRGAIRGDIRMERWEAALSLIDEMERRFGYKEEAERVREELDDARSARIESRLAEAIEMIDSHLLSRQWERAQREIDRLLNALPNDPRVLALTNRLRSAREVHKAELKAAWNDAVRRSDTDHAIDVLRELDQYLSPTEAQTLRSSARDVFKEKLLQFGIQFRFAVTERRWQDALDIGLELIRDFPNARMANEVREVLDMLRERARQGPESEPAATSESP